MARIVAQRVSEASVAVDGTVLASIEHGLVVLVGIGLGDTTGGVEKLADKATVMRIFEDEAGKMNRSVLDTQGAILAISQFTLYGDLRKGRRPSFIGAADPELGKTLYDHFCSRVESHGIRVGRGQFGAHMVVSLVNDGPVTIILDSNEL